MATEKGKIPDHHSIAVTLAAYDAATKQALAARSNRKAVASKAILAFANPQRSHNKLMPWLTAFVIGLALGWLAFGTVP